MDFLYRYVHDENIKQGFFQQFWEKAPGQYWEKMINLTSKYGEINNIEHNKGSKIYPQNQIILDFIMPSIPLKHKCLILQIFRERYEITLLTSGIWLNPNIFLSKIRISK